MTRPSRRGAGIRTRCAPMTMPATRARPRRRRWASRSRLPPMPIPRRFVKMSGGGNDFLVFEADGRALSESDRERVARLCRRGVSVGADGALFLSGGESSRIHLEYFNSDGGLASFCANGTRCAARYAVSRRLVAGNTVVLETGWDAIDAQVHEDGELVSLVLPPLLPPGEPIPISGAGLPATG